MNIKIVQNLQNEFPSSFIKQIAGLDFAEDIQKDEELLFYLEAFIKASSIQLTRIEENYLYDQLENGNLLASLSEGLTQLTLIQAVDFIKFLGGCSYYKEEAYRLHKVCKGHFDKLVRRSVPYRNEEHIKKEEQKILEAWKQKEGVKPESAMIKQSVSRNLAFTRRFCDFYVSYTHIDNFQDCSYPYTKKRFIQDSSFEGVIHQFEEKIKLHKLDEKAEWSKLAKQIFGENLVLIH